MDSELALEKAKKRIRQKEAVRQLSDILKGKTEKSGSKSGKNHDDLPQKFKVTHKKYTCCGKSQYS